MGLYTLVPSDHCLWICASAGSSLGGVPCSQWGWHFYRAYRHGIRSGFRRLVQPSDQSQLGIPFYNPRQLYLAYHEGRGGYARKTFARKPEVTALASRVQARAFRYDNQLKSCEQEFQCWRWYQFWPFCSANPSPQ